MLKNRVTAVIVPRGGGTKSYPAVALIEYLHVLNARMHSGQIPKLTTLEPTTIAPVLSDGVTDVFCCTIHVTRH